MLNFKIKAEKKYNFQPGFTFEYYDNYEKGKKVVVVIKKEVYPFHNRVSGKVIIERCYEDTIGKRWTESYLIKQLNSSHFEIIK